MNEEISYGNLTGVTMVYTNSKGEEIKEDIKIFNTSVKKNDNDKDEISMNYSNMGRGYTGYFEPTYIDSEFLASLLGSNGGKATEKLFKIYRKTKNRRIKRKVNNRINSILFKELSK